MLNPATMVFMGFVLGWNWVALRIVVGILLVFGVAHVIGVLTERSSSPLAVAPPQAAELAGHAQPLLIRWARTFWQLSTGLVPEYLVIVAAMGAARAWLFPVISPTTGHSLWLVLALALTGTLFVIPTAGEVPIVQTLMSFGLGPGGAGALLTTLPPISLPSLIMVGRGISPRALSLVAASVFALGVLTGLAAIALKF